MIRSIFFKFFFFFGIILICIIFLPSFFLPKKITLYGGRLMGFWCKICLNIILSTKIIIKGEENIILDKKFFIACSHQSMFETFFLQTIFNSPVFILKKELLKIPIFGWYLKKIGSISIDRNKINKENLNFKDQITNVVKSTNRPIIIFPQATRSEPLDRTPFKKGAARIYEDLNIICQPVAINSGNVWPKYGSLKSNKKIIVSILKSIEPGKDKIEFLKSLENSIYSELDKLN
jgi:1-acyl-sn-glycerol-3-phosphate acyltransferase|tara:strand:+ start:379 stop:1080 length:702 start_codon:yes stop_codon:yes gene_type:complete